MKEQAGIIRKRKTRSPCTGCGMHANLCFCAEIPSLQLETKLSLIIHYQEMKRTTNTGRLATHALLNSDLWVRGRRDVPAFTADEVLDLDYYPLLLYPAKDAELLTSSFIGKIKMPIQLIVPDGNWRQAGKVMNRYPEFKSVKKVKLTPIFDNTTQIRKETTAEGMSTLQAIATALSVIEGCSVGEQLNHLYLTKARQTLRGRQGPH